VAHLEVAKWATGPDGNTLGAKNVF